MKKKKKVYQRQADILKAIAHPLRLEILDNLKKDPMYVQQIAAKVNSERSNVSRHLAVMVNAGILNYVRSGKNVVYELKTPCILNSLDCAAGVIKENKKTTKSLQRAL